MNASRPRPAPERNPLRRGLLRRVPPRGAHRARPRPDGQAGFTVIRVGESVWSTWEPRDGEFDLDWLQPVLDGAHERGIAVILGTPTYAVPPWLQTRVPRDRRRAPHRGARCRGARARRSTTRIPRSCSTPSASSARSSRATPTTPPSSATRSTTSPAWCSSTTAASFQRFVRRLKAQYGDVETLNREWGLTYWSHRLRDWSELWTPDGNTLPQYDLAWRRYQADLTTEFIAWQAGIVREYARPEPVRDHVHRVPAPGDRRRGARRGARRHRGQPVLRDAGPPRRDDVDLEPVTPWTTSGVAGAVPAGRPHVLVEAVAVPRHRDRRAVHRRVRSSTSRPTRAS